MPGGQHVFGHLMHLYKVFICLGSTEYEKAITMQLLLILYWRQHQNMLPVWAMMESHFACFNEEPGEISLSVLSRLTKRDTMKHDFDHLSTKFKLVHMYHQMADMFSDVLMKRGTWERSHYCVEPTGGDVKILERFFRDMIDNIVADKYTPYAPVKQASGTAAEERKNAAPMTNVKRVFIPNMKEAVEKRIVATRAYLNKPFAENIITYFTSHLHQPPQVNPMDMDVIMNMPDAQLESKEREEKVEPDKQGAQQERSRKRRKQQRVKHLPKVAAAASDSSLSDQDMDDTILITSSEEDSNADTEDETNDVVAARVLGPPSPTALRDRVRNSHHGLREATGIDYRYAYRDQVTGFIYHQPPRRRRK
jgi:hypothetical protein